jgi:hypothetical protein
MSNAALTAITLAFLAAHVAALILALARKPAGAAAIPAVNIVVAVVLLAYNVPRLVAYPGDGQRVALALFEALALALAAAALWRMRLAYGGSCVVFALHGLASIAAVVFALTFKITRLF